ncbi:MAG: T9SS C-terminal target domain-containing protein [Cytophagales bacterium]|nr:MAG: T9SS C-terminal target domain-containing protein [Cytophagales bacterium]
MKNRFQTLIIILFAVISSKFSFAQTITFNTLLGSDLKANTYLYLPSYITEGNGLVFINETQKNRVSIFTLSGTSMNYFSSIEFNVHGIRILGSVYFHNNRLYTTGIKQVSNKAVIQSYSYLGTNFSLASELVCDNSLGDGSLSDPDRIAVASNTIYVTQNNSSEIKIYTINGNNMGYYFKYGQNGYNNGEFTSIKGMDAEGNKLVVTDDDFFSSVSRVQYFTINGTNLSFVNSYGSLGSSSNNGEFSQIGGVSLRNNKIIIRDDMFGKALSIVGANINHLFNFDYTEASEFAVRGNLLINTSKSKILVRSFVGSNLDPFLVYGTLPGGFFLNLNNLTTDNKGRVFVLDSEAERINIFTRVGDNFSYVSNFSLGIYASTSTDLEVDSDGKYLFVAQPNVNRVLAYDISTNSPTYITNMEDFYQSRYIGNIHSLKYYNNRLYTNYSFTSDAGIAVYSFDGVSFTFLNRNFTSNDINNPLSYNLTREIDIKNDIVYASTPSSSRVTISTISGNNIGIVGSITTATGGGNAFKPPVDIKIMPDGKIAYSSNIVNFVSFTGSNYNTAGSFGTLGSNPSQFVAARNIHVDYKNDKIYVTDFDKKIRVFNYCLPITFGTFQNSYAICPSQIANLTVPVAGFVSSYLWSNSSTTSSIQTSAAGQYTLSVTGNCGIYVANTITVTGLQNTSISMQTSSKTICGGSSTFFGVSPAGHNLKFLWSNGVTTNQFSTSVAGIYQTTVTGTCGNAVSNLMELTVNPITTITSQSILETVCGTNTVGLFVNAEGKNKTYLWSNGNTGDEPTVGAGIYTVTVSGACGTAISSPVTVTSFQNTSISMQTSSKTICGGSSTFFGVSPTGHNLMYLWSNGVTTNQFGTSVAGIYQTTVTGTCGTAVSNLMELTVNPITTITSQSILETVCGTNTVGLFVNAEGKNKTYLWSNGNTGDEPTVGEGIYSVTVSGACGSPAISSPITVTGLPNTSIQSLSQTSVECEGVDMSILVSATGANLSYKWSNGRTIDEIITTALGSYMVTVSGTCGTAISSEVNLQVKPATSIVSISENQVINAGATTNLSISATGENVSYLWSNSSASETISNVSAGSYMVTATGFCGSLVRNILVQETATVSVSGISASGNPSNSTSPLSITVSGSGFINGATVTINGVAINQVTVQDANTIVATLPSGLTLPLSVSIQNPNQVATTSISIAPIDVTIPVASISGVSANGVLTSATSITISGAGFVNGATITVNGVAITNFTVNGSSIVATIPAGTLLANNNVILIQNPNQLSSANTPVVVTDVTLSTNLPTYQSTNFSIYPNPTSNGEWRIENGVLGATMYVFNAQGAIVYTQTITSASTEVSAKISSGIYLVRIGNKSAKLVVD